MLTSALIYPSGGAWLIHDTYPAREDAIGDYRRLSAAYPALAFEVVQVDARLLSAARVRLEVEHQIQR